MSAPETLDPETSIQQKSSEVAPVTSEEVARLTSETLTKLLGAEAPPDMQSSIEAHFRKHPEEATRVAAGVAAVQEKAARAETLSAKFENLTAGAMVKIEKMAPRKVSAVLRRFLIALLYYFSASKRHERATGDDEGGEAQVQTEVTHVAEGAMAAAENVGSVTQADTLKATTDQAFDSRRATEVTGGLYVQDIGQQAMNQIREQLKGSLRGSNLDELQKAHGYVEELNKNAALGHMDIDGKVMSPEQLKTHINYLTAATVNTTMDAEIEAVFAKNGGYKELQEKIEPYVRMEKLGSKKGGEVKEFFSKILRAKLKEVRSEGGGAKVALLEHFMRAHGIVSHD